MSFPSSKICLNEQQPFFLPIVQLATSFAVVVYLGNVTFITIVLIMLMNAILFELNQLPLGRITYI